MIGQNQQLTVKDRLIVALDVSTINEARRIVEDLRDYVGMFKMGLELYASQGLRLFELMREENIKVFFDGKFHDIPNTVAQAARNITLQGVAMLNVHTTGRSAMLIAASAACRQAASEKGLKKPYLIGVTALTSIGSDTLKDELMVAEPVSEYVIGLSRLARSCGLDGVVASAREASEIRAALGDDFIIVTPGIRPSWSSADDQKRIVTPGQALANGADFLVVGRPITKANDRQAAAERVLEEMEAAL